MRVLWLALALALAVLGCKTDRCDLDENGTSWDDVDLAVFKAALGKSKGQPGYNARADVDKSGTVTTEDFGALLKLCQKQ
jgi:hypothetical protein